MKTKNILNSIPFAIVVFFGTIILGFFHGALLDFTQENIFYKITLASYRILTVFYIIFSIFLISKKGNDFSLLINKGISAFLGGYVCLCLLSLIFVGFYSPLTFVGNIIYQAYTGVNFSTLFHQ